MTIDREVLAAYAEGHLDEPERQRVEQAIAADPSLAQEVAAHRALRARLQAHFAPVLDAPVPDRLIAAIGAAASAPSPTAEVIDFATAREAIDRKRRPLLPWVTGGAIAASLMLGLLIGTRMTGGAAIGGNDNALLARGTLDHALTTQLASADATPVRIMLSMRREDGRYCRVFDTAAMAGIACSDDGHWAIERLQSGRRQSGGEFQQAASALGDIMASAQAMAPDGVLNPQQESAAREKGWR